MDTLVCHEFLLSMSDFLEFYRTMVSVYFINICNLKFFSFSQKKNHCVDKFANLSFIHTSALMF